jgi:pimeloyl-ACP methyl ester carboxylesterase
VLVAASGGGFIASTFARQHQEEIAGMVFVDVPRAYQDPPPELVEDLRCDNPNNIERRDYVNVEHDARACAASTCRARSRAGRPSSHRCR